MHAANTTVVYPIGANNPFNGHAWSSETGTAVEERLARMSFITEYATFEPNPGFRSLMDSASAALHPEGEADWWEMGHYRGLPAQRDLALACMGL